MIKKKKEKKHPDLEENKIIALYIKELDVEFLSREQEAELGKRIREHDDKKALDALCESCLPLVLKIAKQYKGRGAEYMELVQEGNIGLWRAAKGFDYRMGYRFSTYATWWIRQAISRYLQDKVRLVKIPVYAQSDYFKIRRAQIEFENTRGREPTIKELAKKTGMPEEKIKKSLLIMSGRSSPILFREESEERGGILEETLPDEDHPSPEQELLMKELVKLIADSHRRLGQREIDILYMRYFQDKTLAEIGKKFNVSRERIRQIQKKTEKELRKIIKNLDFRT